MGENDQPESAPEESKETVEKQEPETPEEPSSE